MRVDTKQREKYNPHPLLDVNKPLDVSHSEIEFLIWSNKAPSVWIINAISIFF